MKYLLCEFEKLSEKYCVTFGGSENLHFVTEYFSFSCPFCINLFRRDFERLKQILIQEKKIKFVFHPIPLDILTIQAMICIEQLSSNEKCSFIEVIMQEADPSNLSTLTRLMKKTMRLFKKPIPDLDKTDFITNHNVYQDALSFLKQKTKIGITAIPTIEINGKIYPEMIPQSTFIELHINEVSV